jgi:hypothetical protein
MSRRDVDAEFKWLIEFYDENVDSIINRDVVLGFDSMFLRLKEFDDLDKRKTGLNTAKQRLLQDENKLVQKLKELEEKTEKKVKSEKPVNKKKEIAMVIQKLKEDIRRISVELEEIARVDEKEIKAELKNIKDTVINCTTEIVNEMIEAGALVAGFLKHEEDDKDDEEDEDDDDEDDDDEEDEDDDDVFEPVTIRELVISSFIVSVKLINDKQPPYLLKLFKYKSGTKIQSKKIISLIFAILERTDYQGCKGIFGIRRSPFLSRRKVPKSLQRSAQKRQKKKSKANQKSVRRNPAVAVSPKKCKFYEE